MAALVADAVTSAVAVSGTSDVVTEAAVIVAISVVAVGNDTIGLPLGATDAVERSIVVVALPSDRVAAVADVVTTVFDEETVLDAVVALTDIMFGAVVDTTGVTLLVSADAKVGAFVNVDCPSVTNDDTVVVGLSPKVGVAVRMAVLVIGGDVLVAIVAFWQHGGLNMYGMKVLHAAVALGPATI